MKEGLELHIRLTRNLPSPTAYAVALNGEFANDAYNEERAPEFKGVWREKSFNVPANTPFDLEIGTGNGFYFAHHAQTHLDRVLLGVEIKYKPLIQTIRRAIKNGSTNMKIARYNANFAWELFGDEELDNIYIHFPDPWIKKSRNKNRLINSTFLEEMYKKQKVNSFIEFKTDSLGYFNWSMDFFNASSYEVEEVTYDLHNSPLAETNFSTHFEKIFLKQDIKINYARLYKRG